MKRLTSTWRWFGPLLTRVLLILALLLLAACNNTNNGSNNSTNNGSGSSNSGSGSSNSGSGSSNSGTSMCSGTSNCVDYQITVQQATSATWDVTVNSVTSPPSFNGYIPNAGYKFLIVDASFTNISSGTQILGSGLFVVQDSNNRQYSEDQASNPGQTFTLNPNQNIETQTAYVVPESQCSFTLTFVGNSGGNNLQWSISSC